MPFICKLAKPESLLKPSFMGLSCSGPLSPYPNHPRGRYQTTRAQFQSLLKLFALANLKPAYLAFPISSLRNRNEGLCPCFPLSICLLANPAASLCGPPFHGVPLSLGICESNKPSYQWQPSPDLPALLYLNSSNKTYTLKQ